MMTSEKFTEINKEKSLTSEKKGYVIQPISYILLITSSLNEIAQMYPSKNKQWFSFLCKVWLGYHSSLRNYRRVPMWIFLGSHSPWTLSRWCTGNKALPHEVQSLSTTEMKPGLESVPAYSYSFSESSGLWPRTQTVQETTL